MSFFNLSPIHPVVLSGVLTRPDSNTRGKSNITALMNPLVRDRLSTDAIGQSTLTVSNVITGSEVRLFSNADGECAGGIESSSGSGSIILTYNIYTIPAQGFLVILRPGYHPVRIPFQLSKLPLAYTAYQVADPSYLTT